MINRREPGRAWWRALAVGLIVLQLVAALHGAWTRHERCAAHGELIHAEVTQPSGLPSPVVDPGGANGWWGGGAMVGHPSDHDHCAAAAPAMTTESAVLTVALQVTTPPAPRCSPLAIAPRIATYRVAPKTSPPSA